MSAVTLFDKLYEGAEKVKKALKKPVAERSMRRRFHSAYDDACRIIDEADIALLEEREKINECDVNILLKERGKIVIAKELQVLITEEYLELFGEEFVV